MKYIFLCLFLLTSTFYINAQTISGKVTDTDLRPIPEVFIYHSKSDHHVHTNASGNFEINNVEVGDELVFSHVSYSTQQFVVENLNSPIVLALEQGNVVIDEIILQPTLKALNVSSAIDLQTNPVNSSQEILRKVPGLFIGQHAGGGKAEQIFLRGFDIDHGTDISLSVDGMPINMVSHAHGQGYADMHFIIPETIDNIDFGKGPFYAAEGNFNTAGYVNFKTKNYLKKSSIQQEIGQFDTYRTLGMFNLVNNTKTSAYVAGEFLQSNGPFEAPQNFDRVNVMGKFTTRVNDSDQLSLIASRFTSNWDASGQIPERAVESGLITRFGAIDSTEGGQTSRTNVGLNYSKIVDENTSIESNVFYSAYDFELFSNFTFFAANPTRGDQIKQFEDRSIFGLNTVFSNYGDLGNGGEVLLQAGIGMRTDQVEDNELSRTANRSELLENLALGEVNETNLNAFLNAEFDLGKWLVNPSVRVDRFSFEYNDALQTAYETQAEDEIIVSPNLNFIYNASQDLQAYVKSGFGFHSNDTRVVVAQEGEDILPYAFGTDLGAVWKPSSSLILNSALWYLFLEQEFVYVGDEAVVEPSGKTERMGIDFGARYQINDWLYFDSDLTYTHARAIEEADGADLIPLAPDFTAAGGLSIRQDGGFFGGIRYRYLDDRPANEDNSIIARGYTVADLNIGYEWPAVTVGVNVENIFDVDWNETQFATESRLFNEMSPVEEIHFTPGTPFLAKFRARYSF